MFGVGSRRRSGRWRLAIGLVVLLLCVTAAAGLARLVTGAGPGVFPGAIWRLLGLRVQPPTPREGQPVGGQPAGVEPGSSPPPPGSEPPAVLARDARLVWTVVYRDCGCYETRETAAEAGLSGLDQAQLVTELRAAWEVTVFAPGRVELRRTEPGQCPRHTKRTLRLEGGSLILYAGSLEDEGTELILIGPATSASLGQNDLGPAEAENLRVGRSFDTQEEVYRYLEGLGD